jgi:hypothetical protein
MRERKRYIFRRKRRGYPVLLGLLMSSGVLGYCMAASYFLPSAERCAALVERFAAGDRSTELFAEIWTYPNISRSGSGTVQAVVPDRLNVITGGRGKILEIYCD